MYYSDSTCILFTAQQAKRRSAVEAPWHLTSASSCEVSEPSCTPRAGSKKRLGGTEVRGRAVRLGFASWVVSWVKRSGQRSRAWHPKSLIWVLRWLQVLGGGFRCAFWCEWRAKQSGGAPSKASKASATLKTQTEGLSSLCPTLPAESRGRSQQMRPELLDCLGLGFRV